MKTEKKYYLFLLPSILISLCVVFIPGIMTFFVAFTDWNGFAPEINFIGVENFKEIFSNRYFWVALKNNCIWTLLFLTIPVVIGMGAAFLILKRKRTRNVLQTIFLTIIYFAALRQTPQDQAAASALFMSIFGLIASGFYAKQSSKEERD